MSMAAACRIALGSAQFGQRYGVANRSGAPTQREMDLVVHRARDAGVDTIDTAIAYGDSESMLGAAGLSGFRLVTKLPPISIRAADVEREMREEVRHSLGRLGVERLHGLLLHRAADAISNPPVAAEVRRVLAALATEGIIGRAGVSVYEPTELEAVADVMPLGIVQAPYNVLDRRFDESGWFSRLRAAGAEIHVRSVFLQGLLLLDDGQMPSAFDKWNPVWSRWRAWLRERDVSAVTGALGAVLSNPNVDRVVVGVDTLAQWNEVLAAASSDRGVMPDDPGCDDMQLINPMNWSRV